MYFINVVPAACLSLNALSSSSSWTAFFFGFLLWMGLVPAGIVRQYLHGIVFMVVGKTHIPFLKAFWRMRVGTRVC